MEARGVTEGQKAAYSAAETPVYGKSMDSDTVTGTSHQLKMWDDPKPIIKKLLAKIRHQVRGHEWGCYASEPCKCGYQQLKDAVEEANEWLERN